MDPRVMHEDDNNECGIKSNIKNEWELEKCVIPDLLVRRLVYL
jgi:hypothetical protein